MYLNTCLSLLRVAAGGGGHGHGGGGLLSRKKKHSTGFSYEGAFNPRYFNDSSSLEIFNMVVHRK